ncbi:MAG: hypothetical protein IKS90_02655 [Clostridia bacterium]|nr:hypothetical protein [Clostridia bacterium]
MKKRNGIIVSVAAVVLLTALFAVFARGKNADMPASTSKSASGVASPTQIPSGIPLGKLIPALLSAGMECEFSEAERVGGNIQYNFYYDGERRGELLLNTDALGRIVDAKLTLCYLYGGEPGEWISPEVAAVIRNEYLRRENVDTALVEAYLDGVLSLYDGGADSVDITKLKQAVKDAYIGRKPLDKKLASKLHFYSETKEEANEYTYSLAVSVRYSK